MQKKFKWFKVEFLIYGGTIERYRTIKVPIDGSNESLKDFLRRKIYGLGFRNFELLQWECTSQNYL